MLCRQSEDRKACHDFCSKFTTRGPLTKLARKGRQKLLHSLLAGAVSFGTRFFVGELRLLPKATASPPYQSPEMHEATTCFQPSFRGPVSFSGYADQPRQPSPRQSGSRITRIGSPLLSSFQHVPDLNQRKGRTNPETAVRRRLLLKARQTIHFYRWDFSYKGHSELEAGHDSD